MWNAQHEHISRCPHACQRELKQHYSRERQLDQHTTNMSLDTTSPASRPHALNDDSSRADALANILGAAAVTAPASDESSPEEEDDDQEPVVAKPKPQKADMAPAMPLARAARSTEEKFVELKAKSWTSMSVALELVPERLLNKPDRMIGGRPERGVGELFARFGLSKESFASMFEAAEQNVLRVMAALKWTNAAWSVNAKRPSSRTSMRTCSWPYA
ncbi:hypothetical protein B0I35DRAFT_455770 [Stachybotrys elegans]|uniref:Uncharacterized protein n=1 Tax=Stachybotrys elegans TaxID=80388 RepID=A0A8K0WWE6_9HYPO|nr:hypothetical protein B0I35DRAFT_455770 [Stachybotrys elegans]